MSSLLPFKYRLLVFITFKQISVWSRKKIISAEKLPLVHQKIRDAISKSNAAYRVYRFKFIDNILSTLLISLLDDDKIIHQKLEMVNKSLSQTCTNQECRKIYHFSLKRKCVCGASVEKLLQKPLLPLFLQHLNWWMVAILDKLHLNSGQQ